MNDKNSSNYFDRKLLSDQSKLKLSSQNKEMSQFPDVIQIMNFRQL